MRADVIVLGAGMVGVGVALHLQQRGRDVVLVDRRGAGEAARALVQHQGWIRCLRTEESLRRAIADARRLDQYGVDYAILSGAELRELEPHVSEKITGAIHFLGSPSSSDPGMLTKAYADLFLRKGGRFLIGDARALIAEAFGWSLRSESAPIPAREAVV